MQLFLVGDFCEAFNRIIVLKRSAAELRIRSFNASEQLQTGSDEISNRFDMYAGNAVSFGTATHLFTTRSILNWKRYATR